MNFITNVTYRTQLNSKVSKCLNSCLQKVRCTCSVGLHSKVGFLTDSMERGCSSMQLLTETEVMLEYPGFIHFGTGSPMGDHMDAGDDQTGMRNHMDKGDAWRHLCKVK